MTKKIKKFKHTQVHRQQKKQNSGLQGESFQQNILQQALTLHQAGRLPQAESLYRKILLAEPNHHRALHYLGILAHQVGKYEIAVELISKALNCRPDYAEAHNNLGNVLRDQGKMAEAISSYRLALTLKPNFADAHINLGNGLRAQGKLDEAVASYRRALTLKPNDAVVHNNLGSLLSDQGKLDEAVASYRRALTLKPDDAVAHNNLGNTLKDQGKLNKAIFCYRRALTLKPDYALAYYNLGNCLKDQGKLDEAAASYRKALTLKPDDAVVHINLGSLLNDQGKLDEAIACYRRALTLEPDYFDAHSNLLLCLNYLPNQSITHHLDEARRYGRKAKGKVSMRFSDWICSTKPERLRIGLVSSDFRNHPVGYFLENLLANIDPTQIDLVAYPTLDNEDELTARIRSHFIAWNPLLGMHDEAAARLIHDDGVHVLLDLSGHTGHNRLPVFAWKPAPVQATWLGYFASTGIAEIDYLIADPVSVPKSHQKHFTEKVWYLPETRFCFSSPVIGKEPAITTLPALRNGHITFGSFQKLAKINDEVLAVWGRIFRVLPQARLQLQNCQLNSPAIRGQLQQRLAQSGIAPEQVTFAKHVPRIEYLAAHTHIDIILDTFPFTGGTTTCEALWMGVPTVTLAGNTMVARQGASLLSCAGLKDWIAVDYEGYVAKALAHAADLEKLTLLRAELRQQVLASPLFDGPRFARNFEAAMWGMWRSFQADQ